MKDQGSPSTPDDSKRNVKYVKAGLVLTALAVGAMPTIVGGAIAIKVGGPLLNDMLMTASGKVPAPTSSNVPRERLTPGFLPRCYHQLIYGIAPDWRSEKRVCSECRIPYQQGVLKSKACWEHIRKTGRDDFTAPVLDSSDLLRTMDDQEAVVFREFCRARGNLCVEQILAA